MMQILSERLKMLKPYTAGEQPFGKKYIKLNTNENPYPPPIGVANALKDFKAGSLRLYPDPTSENLREVIAKKEGVSTENVFVGNGSDEVLAFAFYALFDKVMFFDITYSFYSVYCKMFGIEYETLPLRANFSADLGKLSGIKCGLCIANPNAPTSLGVLASDIERIVKGTDFPVLVDEAYIDFADEETSAVPLIKACKNLMIVKTLSKSYSLAGLRCGYAIASKELISALNAVKDSFNSYPVDAVCSALSIAALSDSEHHTECCKKIIATREKTAATLKSFGVNVLPSQTNFLFISVTNLGIGGERLYGELKDVGFLVRHFNKERIDGFVRVSIGTDKEMEAFCKAVESIVGQR